MTAACGLLEAELALDRIAAELATELPAHLRVLAAALATGAAPPPAPPPLMSAATVATLQRAMQHPVLADRARAVARLVVPAVIEGERSVAAIRVRAAPAWEDYAALAAARDAAARARFARPFLALMHGLHGVAAGPPGELPPWPAPIAGWHARGARLATADLEAMWRELAAPYDLPATPRILRGEGARARTVIVEPRREVIVVLPAAIETPAARFAALHELGHALAGLLIGELPRVLDEAVAATVARRMEEPRSPWFSEFAAAARARRVRVARGLDAIERGRSSARPTERPPWALWHDPGAQAAYVEAEAIADTLAGGDLAAAITSKMRG